MVILAVIYQECIETGASFYNCEFLIATGPPLQLLCSGHYSSELKLRYRDNLVDTNAPYRIWARSYSSYMRQIFVSFYESPISHCSNITCHLNWLHCDKSEMFGIIVHPEEIHCFRYTFSYVRDLQQACNAHVDESADYVGIHYANLFDLNTNSTTTILRKGSKLAMLLKFLVLLWSWKPLNLVLQMALNRSFIGPII
ncbi:hypothetical protein ACLKA6_010904 [Drosophila palustris]